MAKMGIVTPTLRICEMALTLEDRTDSLIETGEKLCCDAYLSPTGLSVYLAADGFVDRPTIDLEYANEAPQAITAR
jgi:hypothetical protein